MPATSTPVVNEALAYILVFSLLLFFAIVFLMVYFVVRYRRTRSPEASKISGSVPLEVLWIVLPTLIVLTMFVYGLTGFTFLRTVPAGSFKVGVLARQWSWQFQYENGVKSRDLVVPAGRPVALELTSQDVIHSFFVPAFRVKVDCVPGMKTKTWFNATRTGSYDIMCGEYCGTLHSRMLANLVVAPPEEFDKWYAGRQANIPGVSSRAEVAEGLRLLEEKGCLGCHSLDGSVLAGPSLKGLYGSTIEVFTAGQRRKVLVDEKYIETSLVDPHRDVAVGYKDIMQSAKGKLSDQEMDVIISYIKELR
jgi:cytochrome c oxidase subunit II